MLPGSKQYLYRLLDLYGDIFCVNKLVWHSKSLRVESTNESFFHSHLKTQFKFAAIYEAFVFCVMFSCFPGFNQLLVENKSKFLAQGNNTVNLVSFEHTTTQSKV